MFLKVSQYSQKTPVFESLFNKVTGLKTGNFIIKRIRHRCFPVNIENFLRTVFYGASPVPAFQNTVLQCIVNIRVVGDFDIDFKNEKDFKLDKLNNF